MRISDWSSDVCSSDLEAADATGDKAAELRESAMRSLKRTREALYDTQDALLERGRKAARATDDYVHDNPWQAIGMAGLAGVLIGRSEEHTSELQSLMRISYAVFCLKKNKKQKHI